MRLKLFHSFVLIVLSASPVSADWTFMYQGEFTYMNEGMPESGETVKENYFADLSSIKMGLNSVWVMGVYEPPAAFKNPVTNQTLMVLTKWKELWKLNCRSLSYERLRGMSYTIPLTVGSSPAEQAEDYGDEKKTVYPEPDSEHHSVLNMLCKANSED